MTQGLSSPDLTRGSHQIAVIAETTVIAEIPSLREFRLKSPSLRGFEKAEAISFKIQSLRESPSLRGSKANDEAISLKA